MRSCHISTPGKVLLAGGYSVVQGGSGISLALDARYHTLLQAQSFTNDSHAPIGPLKTYIFTIDSPQYCKKWCYHARVGFSNQWHPHQSPAMPIEFRIDQVVDNPEFEPFPQPFLYTSIMYALAVLTSNTHSTILDADEYQINCTIRGDNSFYAHFRTAFLQHEKVTCDMLSNLPPHMPLDSQVTKTGIGSSSALVSSLICAILCWGFDWYKSASSQDVNQVTLAGEDKTSSLHHSHPSTTSTSSLIDSDYSLPPTYCLNAHENDPRSLFHHTNLSLVHNVAQAAHSQAQGKIGSGFDIATAIYGSIYYLMIKKNGLNNMMTCYTTMIQAKEHQLLPHTDSPSPTHISKQQQSLHTISPTSTHTNSLPVSLAQSCQDWLQIVSKEMYKVWVNPSNKAMQLPCELSLRLGKTRSKDMHTPTCIERVFEWAKNHSQVSSSCFNLIETQTVHLHQLLMTIIQLYHAYPEIVNQVIARCSKYPFDQWARVFDQEKTPTVGKNLQIVLNSFQAIRSSSTNIRRARQNLGRLAEVPIEPEPIIALLDQLETLPGMLAVGTPGGILHDHDSPLLNSISPPSSICDPHSTTLDKKESVSEKKSLQNLPDLMDRESTLETFKSIIFPELHSKSKEEFDSISKDSPPGTQTSTDQPDFPKSVSLLDVALNSLHGVFFRPEIKSESYEDVLYQRDESVDVMVKLEKKFLEMILTHPEDVKNLIMGHLMMILSVDKDKDKDKDKDRDLNLNLDSNLDSNSDSDFNPNPNPNPNPNSNPNHNLNPNPNPKPSPQSPSQINLLLKTQLDEIFSQPESHHSNSNPSNLTPSQQSILHLNQFFHSNQIKSNQIKSHQTQSHPIQSNSHPLNQLLVKLIQQWREPFNLMVEPHLDTIHHSSKLIQKMIKKLTHHVFKYYPSLSLSSFHPSYHQHQLTKYTKYAVEVAFWHAIYNDFWVFLKKHYEPETTLYHHQLNQLSKWDAIEFGIHPSYWPTTEKGRWWQTDRNQETKIQPTEKWKTAYLRSISTLKQISFLENPRDKLSCLVESVKLFIHYINSYHIEGGRDPSQFILGGDELLPILMFITIQANIQDLVVECAFMELFIDKDSSIQQAGYLLVTIQNILVLMSTLESRSNETITNCP